MLALSAALLLALAPALPQRSGFAFQPRTVHSASRTWSVHIDPTRTDGNGPSHCRAERDGTEVWSAEFPFTLSKAVLGDAGYLAGYATTHDPDDRRDLGQFVVVLISPSGELVAQHSTARVVNRHTSHSTPDPKAAGLILDQENQRFLVRIQDPDLWRHREEWAVYDTRTGEHLESFTPAELAAPRETDHSRWVLDAASIPGTPHYVTVSAEVRFDREPEVHELVVDIFDLEGQPLTSVLHPLEISRDRDLWREVAEHCLLQREAPGEFSIWLPESGQRLDYRVYQQPDDEGWALVELRRSDYSPAPPELPLRPAAEELALKLVARVELQATAPAARLFAGVQELGFDSSGNVVVLDQADKEEAAATFKVFTPEGKLIQETAFELPQLRPEAGHTWWALEGKRWMLASSWHDEYHESHGQGWWVDVATGEASEIPNWSLTSLGTGFDGGAVASTGDGGFIAVGSPVERSTVLTHLGSYDSDGTARWVQRGATMRVGPGELLGTDGVTVTSTGLIVTIGIVFKSLHVFNASGEWREKIDLEEVFGTPIIIPGRVQALPAGGLLVTDGLMDVPLHLLDEHGVERGALLPRRADGSHDSRLSHSVRVARDGRLWATDGRNVFRLGTDGVADLTIGSPPQMDALGEPGPVLFDPQHQRLVIQDLQTGALHCFGLDGTRLFVARPEPADYEGQGHFGSGRLLACRDGILYAGGRSSPPRWNAYDAQGERLEPVTLGAHDLRIGEGPERWKLDRPAVHCVNVAGQEIVRVERRASRHWFSNLLAVEVAADGTLAILDLSITGQPGALTVRAPADGALVDHVLPGSAGQPRGLAFSGTWAAVWSERSGICMLHVESNRWYHTDVPVTASDWDGFGVEFSPDSTELWTLDGPAMEFRRYALPEE